MFLGLVGFALLLARLPRRTPPADGVPEAPIEDEDLAMLERPRRASTDVLRRYVRGTAASLIPARLRIGELQTRRLATPLPSHDDGWELR